MTRIAKQKSINTLLFEEIVKKSKAKSAEQLVDESYKHGRVDAHEVQIHSFLQQRKSQLAPGVQRFYDEVAVAHQVKTPLNQMGDLLIKMRELGVDALRNLNKRERSQVDEDYQYLKRTFETLASEAAYNNVPIMTADAAHLSMKVLSEGLSLIGLDHFRFNPLNDLNLTDDDDDERFSHNIVTREAAAKSLPIIDKAEKSFDQLIRGLTNVEQHMVENVYKSKIDHSDEGQFIEPDPLAQAQEATAKILLHADLAIRLATADPLTGLSLLGNSGSF